MLEAVCLALHAAKNFQFTRNMWYLRKRFQGTHSRNINDLVAVNRACFYFFKGIIISNCSEGVGGGMVGQYFSQVLSF